MTIDYTSETIQQLLGGTLKGEPPAQIRGIASLDLAKPDDLSFLGNKKYREQVAKSRAGLILVPQGFDGQPAHGQSFLLVPNPSAALARLCERIEAELCPRPLPGIHPSACIAEDAQIDPTAHIGPFTIVETGAKIAAGAVVGPHCTVARRAEIGTGAFLQSHVFIGAYCHIGQHCNLSPGVVIGADGFGYETIEREHRKVPQIGRVVLEDYVDVGANTTIDRARFHETRIGQGTKIDNQVQLGHNVQVGKHCLIVAQTGVSGSSKLGNYVTLAGQVGVIGHVTIGDNTVVTGRSGVNNNIPANMLVRGAPAKEFKSETKLMVMQRRVPELFSRVAKLEEILANNET